MAEELAPTASIHEQASAILAKAAQERAEETPESSDGKLLLFQVRKRQKLKKLPLKLKPMRNKL